MNGHSKTRRNFLKNTVAMASVAIVPRWVLGKGYLAPSDQITLGFIGTGKQSPGLMNAFLSTGETRILAACDVYDIKLSDFTARISKYYTDKAIERKDECATYTDYRELLANAGIDAVVIASPDHQHAAMSVRAAEAGKDIYCEKPLALTIAEGRAMVNATRKHGRVFQTGSMQRSWPEFRQAVELIRNGFIGDVTNVKVSIGGPPKPCDLPAQEIPKGMLWNLWLGPNTIETPFHNDLAPTLKDTFWPRWRDYKEFGGGGMTDWGAHMFDIVQWALDMDSSGPVSITPPDGKDVPFLTYRYANGITMTHENFGINNAVQFIGSKGTLNIQRRKLETTPAEIATQVITDQHQRVYFSDNHYKDFLNAMRTRKPPICDVETGHRTATVCTLGNIAYELKQPLTWDPVKEQFGSADANKMLSRPMKEEWKV